MLASDNILGKQERQSLFLSLSGLTDLPDLILVLVLGPELQVIHSNDPQRVHARSIVTAAN